MKTDNDLMARKIGILKEFLPALLPKYKIMLLEAFSPHDLLTAYIKNTLAGYPRLEDQNLDDLIAHSKVPVDRAISTITLLTLRGYVDNPTSSYFTLTDQVKELLEE